MTGPIARLISILGHPAILMPLGAGIASASTGDSDVIFLSISIAVSFAVLVFVYSQTKARAGHWKHVDASLKSERKELNLAASTTLFIGAAIAALFKVHPGIITTLALSGVIVMASHLLSKFAKPSLHTSFAIFAACLTFPNKIVFSVLILFAFFIAWARIHLQRHTMLDLTLGAGLGILVSFCFQAILRSI